MADAAPPALPRPFGPALDPELERVLERDIRPRIPALEDRRHALAGGLWTGAVVISLVASMVTAWLGGRFGPTPVPFVLLGACTLGVALYLRRVRAWNAALLETVIPPLAAHLGDTRHRAAGSPELLAKAETLALVAPAQHPVVSHRIEGRRRGTDFVATHAAPSRSRRLAAPSRSFHGLLMRLDVRVPPPGPILVVSQRGGLGHATAASPRLRPRLEAVTLGDPEFEERFRVLAHSADPETVRAYLLPRVREALLAIDTAEGGARGAAGLCAAFEHDGFYLALPLQDWVGFGRLGIGRARPFLDGGGILSLYELEPTVRQMAYDLGTPHRIVDRLLG